MSSQTVYRWITGRVEATGWPAYRAKLAANPDLAAAEKLRRTEYNRAYHARDATRQAARSYDGRYKRMRREMTAFLAGWPSSDRPPLRTDLVDFASARGFQVRLETVDRLLRAAGLQES